MNTTAIAQHLNIASQAIIEIQEWAQVIWVKFVGGCRFVSKKVIKMSNYAVVNNIGKIVHKANSNEAAIAWAESKISKSVPGLVFQVVESTKKINQILDRKELKHAQDVGESWVF
jgi:hypothetical protein